MGKLLVVRGDITREETDAIANAADRRGEGVCEIALSAPEGTIQIELK